MLRPLEVLITRYVPVVRTRPLIIRLLLFICAKYVSLLVPTMLVHRLLFRNICKNVWY